MRCIFSLKGYFSESVLPTPNLKTGRSALCLWTACNSRTTLKCIEMLKDLFGSESLKQAAGVETCTCVRGVRISFRKSMRGVGESYGPEYSTS